MPIPNSSPMRFTPRGLVDAYDSTDKFPGACRQLTDLILDQSNPEIVVSRPGVTEIADFTDEFPDPGFVSIQATIGRMVYGMVATSTTPGFDEPFCFDLDAGAFISITGVTGGNVPASPSDSGPWEPPTMANIGIYIVITHPGFDGLGTNFFGVIDISIPAAPAWSSRNFLTTPLIAVPQAVANFNNRAYFAVANTLPYGDVLTLTRTSATQQLTIGDQSRITALSGLPIQTTSSGIIGALVIFKPSQIWQVTGDAAFNSLQQNFISLTIGTKSPRSVAQSPQALYVATDAGPYFIDPFLTLRVLTRTAQDSDPDVQTPFIDVSEPSRVAASYAGSIYRVCLPTILNGQSVTADYWFDEHRRRWTGPHSVPYDCASASGKDFILSAAETPAILIESQSSQGVSSVFTDLGQAQEPIMLSSTFPKPGRMTEKQVVESTQELSASGGNVSYSITAQDEQGNTLGSVDVPVVPAGGLWGAFFWGDGTKWTSRVNIPHVYSLPWSEPLVFKKIAIEIRAQASASLQIGTHFARYEDTGYTNLTAPNTP